MFNFFFFKDKARPFKKYVKQISFEITSQCNRRCAYCPLSLIQRKRCRMNEQILTNVLTSLRSIDYQHSFCLNIYNEPLLDFVYLVDILSKIRKNFPSNIIRFSTNGDLLTSDYISQIFAFGHIELIVTCHIAQHEDWNTYSYLQAVIEKIKLFETLNFYVSVSPNNIHANVQIDTNSVTISARNFFENGVDRAGTLKKIVASHGKRIHPCLRPLVDFSISYDGSVYPCCQFCHGVDELAPYIVGTVREQDIFSLYNSEKMNLFRQMATKGPYAFPCSTCSE